MFLNPQIILTYRTLAKPAWLCYSYRDTLLNSDGSTQSTAIVFHPAPQREYVIQRHDGKTLARTLNKILVSHDKQTNEPGLPYRLHTPRAERRYLTQPRHNTPPQPAAKQDEQGFFYTELH